MPRARCLRLGVLLDGRLVEERICDGATPITLGQSWKCTLSVPVEGLPHQHVLFARDGERFVLRPIEGTPLVIEQGARGKLRAGEVTILYQELALPPAAPRPQLPASIRGTLADRIDRRLAAIVGASLAIHLAIALVAWLRDPETGKLALPHVPSAFVQDTVDVSLPEPVQVAPGPQPGPGIARAIAPPPSTRATVHAPPASHHAPPSVHAPGPDDAARLAGILTDSDETPGGPAGMSRRQPGADLDHQIREVRGHPVTIGDGDHISRTDDRARLGTGRDPLPGETPRLAQLPTVPGDAEPGRRIRVVPAPTPGDDPMPDLVALKIREVYAAGLRRCYTRALASEPDLAAKLSIAFTVDDRGRARDLEATGGDRDLDDCVVDQMSRWWFATPKDGEGKPTEPRYHVGLVLQPD